MRRVFIVVLVAGCSFPDPAVVEGVAGDSSVTETAIGDTSRPDGGDTSTPEGGDTSVADGGTDTFGDTSVVDSGGDTNKPDIGDTGVKMDTMAVCESGLPCDCDGDGDQAMRTGCSGMDCDDGDPRRNSKVSSFLDHSSVGTTHGGDWDCNGTPVREFPAGIACNTYLLTTGCMQQGYREAAPACGSKTATFVRCKNNGAACGEDAPLTIDNFTVKCR